VAGTSSQPVGELLAKWEAGDQEALRALMPLIYNELRRLAHHYLQKARPDHTLQGTALVHEAYLRLAKHRPAHFENRCHFLAVSALLMLLTGSTVWSALSDVHKACHLAN